MNKEKLIELICDALWEFCPKECAWGHEIDVSRSVDLEDIRQWVDKRRGVLVQNPRLSDEQIKGIILKGWCSPETRLSEIFPEPWDYAIADAQLEQFAKWVLELIKAEFAYMSKSMGESDYDKGLATGGAMIYKKIFEELKAQGLGLVKKEDVRLEELKK